jgi:hypothetical protein|nr:MAG TPA: hypothetical protein [Herelleviridae sp.]DAT74245.1 MAG TPA: hypothetical protein [Herelleviridae sp.]
MILIARIRQIVDGLLKYVQQDYEAVPEEETLLYHMFYGVRDKNFDFYQKAKEIFLRRNTSPRKIQTVLEYPLDKSHLPCIVIREPGREQFQDAPIGGYGLPTEDIYGNPEFQREGFRQPSSSKINLMCFSDNSLESVLIGEVLYTLLVGARNTLEEEFLRFEFNTTELLAENKLFPTPILIKNVEMQIAEIDRFASIIRPRLVRDFIIMPAIPVGSDPNWNPPTPDKYFMFSRPYVWLEDDKPEGLNYVFSNTDWVLSIGGNDPFVFGSSHVWLNEISNKGEQEITARSDIQWTLE